jgi:hypothetical protein
MVALVGALASVACACASDGDGQSLRGPDGGLIEFDAAVLEPPLPPAVVNEDGVLTPFPHLRFFVDPGYRLQTANFVITDDGDARGPLLQFYAELENQTGSIRCRFLPDIWLDSKEIIAVVTAHPYYEQYFNGDLSSVTNSCIPHGSIGVFYGVARGVTYDDIAQAYALFVDPKPFLSSLTYVLPTDGPLLEDMQVALDEEGWGLRGTVRVRASIWNYALRVYPRDHRGVLTDELYAFPGSLDTLHAWSTHSFQTSRTTGAFDEFRAFQSWIRN